MERLYFQDSRFNPRSREGSDQDGRECSSRILMFQSTLPRGERPGWARVQFPNFNVSIHAPARGATKYWPDFGLGGGGFNPRSREGSDPVDT